ncbi:hypothetical protein [Spongiactinospora sp. TRM90649]|nr:hypothetical protein [Spongiactinospora sp. TRM90649]MDF5751091.1 hypothetical protein [Spongiactinospora sp. TRM90649]
MNDQKWAARPEKEHRKGCRVVTGATEAGLTQPEGDENALIAYLDDLGDH